MRPQCGVATALRWAAAVVGGYYFVTTSVYFALMSGVYEYSGFDSSCVHDTISGRRYLIAALVPGTVAARKPGGAGGARRASMHTCSVASSAGHKPAYA